MADVKLSALPLLTAAASGDYVPFTTTPGGTPVSKNITVNNLFAGWSASLLSATNLPLNANGDTTLYTVPASKRCVLLFAVLVAGADAGSTDITIGQDTAESDWLPTNQLDNLDAQYDAVILMPVPATTPTKIKSYAAGTVIQANIANQAGGATNTLYLFGFLYAV